jgi:hypothetical protein
MSVRHALKEQYHAGLAMLAECVEKCPDDLWTMGPQRRTFWRIAFHAAFYAHLYLGQDEASYEKWEGRREGCEELWNQPWSVEPFELPTDVEPWWRAETLAYIAFIDSLVDRTVDSLDLDRPDTGFPWYKNMTKLSHELMSVRHIQGHVGQLSELLMARGIDTDWIGKSGPMARGQG